MPIGIRPINDFAFKKVFGSAENKVALLSLLNAILELERPIVDVTIENPFNLQDFHDDKLSILDIKAVDHAGAIYDIEMQLSNTPGLVNRIVFYGCEIYAGQLKSGNAYHELRPVFAICLLDGILWSDSGKVHHAFRFSDRDSGRILQGTLEIHTLELGRYNVQKGALANATPLDCWLYWLLHAHELESGELARLFPQEGIRQATKSITRIAAQTEDKAMYDAREKAARDRQWIIESSRLAGLEKGLEEGLEKGRDEGRQEGRQEGREEAQIEGKREQIRMLEEILQLPLTSDAELAAKSLAELQAIVAELQAKARHRGS